MLMLRLKAKVPTKFWTKKNTKVTDIRPSLSVEQKIMDYSEFERRGINRDRKILCSNPVSAW